MRFKDKVVLVTGASQNTGVYIAAQFLKEGAKVVINSVDRANLESVYTDFHNAYGNVVHRFVADISDEIEVSKMFHYIFGMYGRIDVLVNNATNLGIGPSFEQLSLKEFKAVINVNLFGTFLVSRFAVAQMLKQETKGVIVHLGSNVSKRAIRNRTAYIASKGGIDSLTKAMAVDLGWKGIRTNAVAPGYIYTDRWDNLEEKVKERRRRNIPLGIEASRDQIADAVLFLASDDAANINGTVLVVDGGCSAQHLPLDVDL